MTSKRIRQPTTQTRTTSTPINLPTFWSPEQAAAVFEFLDELRERVLSHYGVEIQEFLQEDRVTATPFTPSDIDENDVPF